MRKYNLVLLAVLIIFSLFFYGCSQKGEGQDPGVFKMSLPFGRSYNYEDILVRRVVDGDTLVLENGQRVRLIGIDTPETRINGRLYQQAQRSKTDIQTVMSQGRKSYQFTRKLVEGRRVRLEFDVEKYDKYSRLLCYVYLKDETFVNLKIVQQGHASLLTIPPNVKYVDLFRAAYQEARENNRGLWSE